MPSTSISKYLSALLDDYEFLRREQPISKKKKRTHYFIGSNIIDFWFRFCFNQREELDRGNDEIVFEDFLKQFPTFYGLKFENIIIDLLPAYLKREGIAYRYIGKDWGKDYEFDFVVEGEEAIYIGEIKKGELNVAREIEKIESVTRAEFYYKNKTIRFILIADRFSNKVDKKEILYATAEEYFKSLFF